MPLWNRGQCCVLYLVLNYSYRSLNHCPNASYMHGAIKRFSVKLVVCQFVDHIMSACSIFDDPFSWYSYQVQWYHVREDDPYWFQFTRSRSNSWSEGHLCPHNIKINVPSTDSSQTLFKEVNGSNWFSGHNVNVHVCIQIKCLLFNI